MANEKKIYDNLMTKNELGNKLDEIVTLCLESKVFGFSMTGTFTHDDKEYSVMITMDIFSSADSADEHGSCHMRILAKDEE